jgi:hypothetical protein
VLRRRRCRHNNHLEGQPAVSMVAKEVAALCQFWYSSRNY